MRYRTSVIGYRLSVIAVRLSVIEINNFQLLIFNLVKMDLTGNIIAALPAQSGVSARAGNKWMSQEYVIEVPGMYPKKMCFRVFGEDRIRQFALQQGQQNVTIQFDIDAHEHDGRWFNEVRCYNVMRAVSVAAAPQSLQGEGSNDKPPF